MVSPLVLASSPKRPDKPFYPPPEDDLEEIGDELAASAVHEIEKPYSARVSQPEDNWDGDGPPPPDAFAPGLEYGGYRADLHLAEIVSEPDALESILAADLITTSLSVDTDQTLVGDFESSGFTR